MYRKFLYLLFPSLIIPLPVFFRLINPTPKGPFNDTIRLVMRLSTLII